MDLQELEETAQLAHLNLGKDELAAALPAFEQMIGFFAAMQEADADPVFASLPGGKPGNGGETAQGQDKPYQAAGAMLAGAGHFRADAAVSAGNAGSVPGTASGLDEKLLDNAGERDGRFIVIPNVL